MPNIQDLSADYYAEDDVVGAEEEKRSKRKKKINWIVGLSVTAVLLVGLALIYYFLVTDWIADYRTIPYLTYRYSEDDDTAVITSITLEQEDEKKTYPENFRIPSKINGRTIVGIEDQAFMGATRLKKVTMPDTITYIGDECFSGCTSLEEIQFSAGLTSIGVDAFYNTKYLANLPNDDVTIWNDILINVGANYFKPNTLLVNTQEKGNELKRDERYADCEIALYSDLNKGVDISYWLDGLFRNNDKLVYVEMPDYLDYVPVRAFQNCSNLIGIEFPEGVTSIGNYAFADCENLVDADVPEQVTSIGSYAFKGTSANISDISHVTSLGEGAFQDCLGVTSIVYPGEWTELTVEVVIDDEGHTKEETYPMPVMDNIPAYCFDGCVNLTDFSFADESAIFTIGTAAFRNTSLTEFTVPHSVTYLLNETFAGCEDLESISFYNNSLGTEHSVYSTRIYEYELQVFESVYTDGIETLYASMFNGCTSLNNISLYDYNSAKTGFEIVTGTDAEGSFHFPTTFTQNRMSDDSSLFANTFVTDVYLDSGLERLGSYAFDGCTSLKNVYFPETYDIDGSTIIADSVLERFGEGAFRNCTSLVGFNYLPASLNYIGTNTFYNCVSLASMDMSNTVVNHIYASAFEGCTALESVNISRSTTAINTGAFKGCVSLDSIILPSSARTLQTGVFTDEIDEDHKDKLAIYYEADEETVSTSTYLSADWYDETCLLYTYSEEEPEEGTTPLYDGYWHYNESGEPVIWGSTNQPD